MRHSLRVRPVSVLAACLWAAFLTTGCLGGGGSGSEGSGGGGGGPEGWVLQHPTPTAALLYSVHFVSDNVGYAGGDGGAMLKTVDGGRTWSLQNTGILERLDAVRFLNSNTGYAVGVSGTGIRTTNGGKTWSSFTLGASLSDVAVLGKDEAIGVGPNGGIRKTEDGGETWFPLPSGTTAELRSVVFPTSQVGFAVGGNGVILRTQDGGETWQTRASGTTRALHAVSFPDANTGYVVGVDGTVQKTTNGGTGWTSSAEGAWQMYGYTLSDVSFRDANNGLVRGFSPFEGKNAVFRTTDGGETWEEDAWADTTIDREVYGIAALSGGRGVGVGYGIYGRNSAGAWEEWSSAATRSPLYSAFFVSNSLGFAVGSGPTILKTTNGGGAWRRISLPSGLSASPFGNLQAVHFVDASVAYASGYPGIILKTTNGGETWSQQASGQEGWLGPIFFEDANTGLVFAEDTVLRTTNGGATWTPSQLPLSTAYGAARTPSGTIFAVGDSTVIKSTDGGATWTSSKVPLTAGFGLTFGLQEVAFPTEATGYATAFSFSGLTQVFKTTDGGATWANTNPQFINPGIMDDVAALVFVNATTGYAVGGLAPWKTTDGGASWAQEDFVLGASFLGGTVTPGGSVVLVGSGGMILKSK